MKKIILLLLFTSLSRPTFSDQLAYISKEQAENTVAFLNDEQISTVILWCACCDNDSKVKVKIDKVYYKYTGYENYYQVYINGRTLDGRNIDEGVDLAYVHIKKGKKWYCLGKELGFKCDPCTKPFKI